MSKEKDFTPELLEKAKSATSAAALLALAQESGVDLTAEEAAEYYASLHSQTGAIFDEELDSISGGYGMTNYPPCPKCHTNKFIVKQHTIYGCSQCDCCFLYLAGHHHIIRP